MSTAHLAQEARRCWVVGMAAYGLDLLVFNVLLVRAQLPSLPAKVVASAVAIAFAFWGNRSWTWRHRRGDDARRELLLFVLLSALAALIPLACLAVSREVLDARTVLADNLSANVVGLVLATAFRFWAFRTFVFRAGPPGHGALGLTPAGAGTPGPAGGAGRS